MLNPPPLPLYQWVGTIIIHTQIKKLGFFFLFKNHRRWDKSKGCVVSKGIYIFTPYFTLEWSEKLSNEQKIKDDSINRVRLLFFVHYSILEQNMEWGWRWSNHNSFSPVHLLNIPKFTFLYSSRSGCPPPIETPNLFDLSHFRWFLKRKNNPIFFWGMNRDYPCPLIKVV